MSNSLTSCLVLMQQHNGALPVTTTSHQLIKHATTIPLAFLLLFSIPAFIPFSIDVSLKCKSSSKLSTVPISILMLQGSGNQIWDLTGQGNHGTMLHYSGGYNIWDATLLPPVIAQSSTALLETFELSSSQFSTISWFAVCIESPNFLFNITAETISGAHATVLASKRRGADTISDPWYEPLWRADETLPAGHDR